ncbi:MAG: HYR domain-containing protein, partial [Deltaproteobacteria bacterium]|nr:HYR domain-containing protein [Deltaproteobacteria bacterium]
MTLVGFVTINEQPAPVGTEVAAFDPDGVLCGLAVVGDLEGAPPGAYLMQVYGDDSTTSDVDEGAEANDSLTFQVYDPTSGIVYEHAALSFSWAGFSAEPPLGQPPSFADRGAFGLNIDAVGEADTDPPALSGLQDLVAEATSPSGAVVTFTVTATDAVDGDVGVTCTPASGSTFPLGATTVTCAATDAAGNRAEGSFTVTVRDTTPPAVTPPGDVSVSATGPLTPVSIGTATATDAVGVVSITNDAPAGGFPVGTTVVTWTARDAAGNEGTATQKVTVTDDRGPVLTLLGANPMELTVGQAYVEPGATATDNVDGDLTGAI